MASTPGFESEPHWCEANGFTSAPPWVPRGVADRSEKKEGFAKSETKSGLELCNKQQRHVQII